MDGALLVKQCSRVNIDTNAAKHWWNKNAHKETSANRNSKYGSSSTQNANLLHLIMVPPNYTNFYIFLGWRGESSRYGKTFSISLGGI